MYRYRYYVKDCLQLDKKAIEYGIVLSGEYKEDLITKASSTTYLKDDSADYVEEGDILCIYDPTGKNVYQGVIESKEKKEIRTNQILSIFDTIWFEETHTSDYLEHEIAIILQNFMQGTYKGVTVDPLLAKKFGSFVVTYEGSQTVHLPAVEDTNSTRNMCDWIYSLYSDYGIKVDISIPQNGQNTIHIYTADYSKIKLANNANCIKDMSPITETVENNKLIIMSSNGSTCRGVYYATPENGITTDGNVRRFKEINTVINFTDETDINSIVEANLSEEMYNHNLTFTMILDNKLYDWFSWKLSQQLEIWHDGKPYNTIYTGYELSLEENQDIKEVKITCGLVRTSLTDKLNMFYKKRG